MGSQLNLLEASSLLMSLFPNPNLWSQVTADLTTDVRSSTGQTTVKAFSSHTVLLSASGHICKQGREKKDW